MSPLQQKLIDAMLLRGFALKTQKSYIASVKGLAAYYGCSPAQLTQEQIQAYFLYLVKKRQLSGSSCMLIRSAIRFFTSMYWVGKMFRCNRWKCLSVPSASPSC